MAFTNASNSLTVPSNATESDPRVVIGDDDPLMNSFATAGTAYYYDLGRGFVLGVQKDGTTTGIFRIAAGPANSNFVDRDEFFHAEYDLTSPLLDSVTLGAGNRSGAFTRPEFRIQFDSPTGTPISIIDLLADSVRFNGKPVGEWQTFNPAWTSSGTAPVLGSGTISARWNRVGNMVTYIGRITLAADSTLGSGSWFVSVPVAAVNAGLTSGSATYLGSSSIGGGCTLNDPAKLIFLTPSSGFVSASVPFAWTSGNQLRWSITYEVAA